MTGAYYKLSCKNGSHSISTKISGRWYNTHKLTRFAVENALSNVPFDDTIPVVPGVRYFDISRRVIAFERPPAIKNVRHHDERLDVPIPWQVYILTFNVYQSHVLLSSLATFWRSEQLRGFDSVLGCAVHPNRYDSGSICMAGETEKIRTMSLAQLCDNAYSMIWEAGFNNDLYPSSERYHGLGTYSARTREAFPHRFKGLHFGKNRPFPTLGHSPTDVLNQTWLWSDSSSIKVGEEPRDGHNEPMLVKKRSKTHNPTLREALIWAAGPKRDPARQLVNRIAGL